MLLINATDDFREKNVNPSVESASSQIGDFSLDDYYDELIEAFDKSIVFGEILNAEQAEKAAEAAWNEIYGKSVPYEKPYKIQYDKEKKYGY